MSQEPVRKNAAPPPQPRLPVLDGLRLLAAAGVMLFHVPGIHDAVPVFERSYLLVDFFFLLSGFVLTLAIEPRFSSGLGAFAFLRQRFLRFWPIAAIGTVLGAITFSGHAPLGQIAFLMPLALLMIPYPNSVDAPVYPLNGPQWSLAWELVANFFHAAVLRRLGARGLLAVAGLFGLALAIVALRENNAAFGAHGSTWWAASLRIGWSYTLGCWIARRWNPATATSPLPWWLAMSLPVIATCAITVTPIDQGLGDVLIILLAYPACLALAAGARCPEAMRRPLERMGAVSFPLYATHIPVVMAFRFVDEGLVSSFLAIASALGVASVIAWLDATGRLNAKALIPSPRKSTPRPEGRLT